LSMQMTPYFVKTGKGQGILDRLAASEQSSSTSRAEQQLLDQVTVCDNLLTAVELILK